MPISDSCYLLWGCCPGFPCCSQVENLPANAGDTRDMDLIPESGRSSGEGNGKPLQYSCLENSMDRGAWRDTVQGVAMSWTQLSTHTQSPGLQFYHHVL